jgi:hypothetical protein
LLARTTRSIDLPELEKLKEIMSKFYAAYNQRNASITTVIYLKPFSPRADIKLKRGGSI